MRIEAEHKGHAEWVTGSPPRHADGWIQLPVKSEHQTRRERDRIVESASTFGQFAGGDVGRCVAVG